MWLDKSRIDIYFSLVMCFIFFLVIIGFRNYIFYFDENIGKIKVKLGKVIEIFVVWVATAGIVYFFYFVR